jgi:hypothetical protein
MSKPLPLLLCAGLCLIPPSALAAGAELTVNACPGNAGASHDAGTLDCAGGEALRLMVTYQPERAIPDLAAVDCVLSMAVPGGLTGPTKFWDLSAANVSALSGSTVLPAAVCSGYKSLFQGAGAGFAVAAGMRGPNTLLISSTAYRPKGVNVAADARLFVLGLTIDASTAVEADPGGLAGCQTPVSIAIESLTPGSLTDSTVTDIKLDSPLRQSIVINGASLPESARTPPPARHSTKVLYR